MKAGRNGGALVDNGGGSVLEILDAALEENDDDWASYVHVHYSLPD